MPHDRRFFRSRGVVAWARGFACVLLLATLPWQAAAAEKAARSDRLKIVFAGDVMLDGGPGHALSIGEDIFADVAGLLTPADISVCNLECVVAPIGHGTHHLQRYTYKARPATIPVLKKYFTAVSVANNHAGDYGPDGLSEELDLLRQAGLLYFGGGKNLSEAHRPAIVVRKGRTVALLGYDGFTPRSYEAGKDRAGVAWLVEEQIMADIKAARAVYHADIVIPMMHWGHEMQPMPEQSQKILARKMIDAGADAVLGAHPHITQIAEVYHGKPIIYSLGNFVFDYYPGDPPVWYGWVVELDFPRTGGPDMNIHTVEIDRAGIPHVKAGAEDSAPAAGAAAVSSKK